MEICKTERLTIRHFHLDDADFILKLLNEDSFIKYIGDKNVRNRSDARNYLTKGPIASYEQYGHGLNMVLLTDSEQPIGMCGLLKRDGLDYPDLGYALLPEYCSQGYAREASLAVLQDGRVNHGLSTVAAITSPENSSSNGLLKSLGFVFKGNVSLHNSTDNLYLYNF